MRRDLQVDDRRQVRDAHPQQRRPHQLGDATGTVVGPGPAQHAPAPAWVRQKPQTAQRNHLQPQLQHAAADHPHHHGVNRLYANGQEPGRAQPCGSDHRQVQQHRRECRNSEMLPCIENPRTQRNQRHETDVGKHPTRHQHCSVEAARILLQSAGHHPHQQRRADHAHRAGQRQRPAQYGSDMVDQQTRLRLALLRLAGAQHRNKGLAKGALGKQPAKHIGQPEGDVEGVGHRGGAKNRRHQQVARHAAHTRCQGQQ